MKKIIGGKKYDTDTATLLGHAMWGESTSDFHYCCESLYRKRTGEFFLLGDGGALSKYAEHLGPNETTCGSRIIPLSNDAARGWAEKYVDVDTYEKAFGEVEE